MKRTSIDMFIAFLKGMRRSLSNTALFALILTLSLTTPSAWALSCSNVFDDLWVATTRVEKNKFVTSRELWEYESSLHPDFKVRLKGLKSDQHWIDLGAGKANAQIDYLKALPNERDGAQTTAVCYKLDRWFSPPKFSGKLEIKEGLFESMPTEKWQKADLITDVFGVLSYSRDMHTSLSKTFDLLKKGGELYIHMTNYSTHFKGATQSLTLEHFLRSIPGLQVEGRFGDLKVTKTQDTIVVPPFKIDTYRDDAPPVRTYILEAE